MREATPPSAQTPEGAEPGRRRPPPGLLGRQPSCPHARTHGHRCRTLGLGDVSPAMFLLQPLIPCKRPSQHLPGWLRM